MDNHFTLSVIIPVYNCERFIEKAVMSVLQQPEVTEIVIVNDGSTDGSLALLKHLQQEQPRMHLYQHPNNANKGRSASRNLGIQKATGDYIAFLDADDYFLPNRFANDKQLFQKNIKTDGVYNAIGAHYYWTSNELDHESLKLYTVTEKIAPDELFETLLSGKKGHFSIISLTVKKSVFDVIGVFNEDLVVAEDTELFWKMALKYQLVPGIIDQPLAMRGIHINNAFSNRDLYEVNDIKLYEFMYVWSSKNNVSMATIERFLERIWILQYRKQEKKYKYFIYWVQLNSRVPRLFFTYLSVKYFPLVRYLQKRF